MGGGVRLGESMKNPQCDGRFMTMEAWGAEAWFQPSPSRNAMIEGWMVVVFGRGIVGRGATMAEAIAALEAAS